MAQARRARRRPNFDAPPQIQPSYVAAQWLDDEAMAWAQQGIDAGDARVWRDLGLQPAEGGRLTRQGRSPTEIIRDWWRAGIPYDELADWLGAGLTAEEAAAQRARGITAEQAASLLALQSAAGADEITPPPPNAANTQARQHSAGSRTGNRPGDTYQTLKQKVHSQLQENLGPTLYDARLTRAEIEQKVRLTLQEVLAAESTPLTVSDRTHLAQEITDEIAPRSSR